jgi:hypothetical protein
MPIYKNTYTNYLNLVSENVKNGEAHEEEWVNYLSKQYPNIKSLKDDEFSIFDAISVENGQNFQFELKTRKEINHNTYPTLMVGVNKIKKAIIDLKKNIRTIFFWNCKDGLYYWEITEENKKEGSWFFNEGEYYISEGGNEKIGQTPKLIAYIRKEYMKRYNYLE